jgi:hypothetical protein
MIAALYGADRYPPYGLEVDVVFSQLRHVGEQMPVSAYHILHDPSGTLRAALEHAQACAPTANWNLLDRQLQWLPFYVHDAVVACRREDSAQLMTLFEEIRQLILFAAALRDGSAYVGSKKSMRHLHDGETADLRRYSRQLDLEGLHGLVRLYRSVLSKTLAPAAIEPRLSTLDQRIALLIPPETAP